MPGDLVLSRHELDPEGEVVAKCVEEVFRNTAAILSVRVGDRAIRTTAEHPFWVQGKGWVAARQLMAEDRLLSHDGQPTVVTVVEDTDEWATVYNVRVADFHTYFVGCDEWGFSVWAHNSNACVTKITKENAINATEKALADGGHDVYRVTAPGKADKIVTGEAAANNLATKWNAELKAAADAAAARAEVARTIAGGHAKDTHLFGDGRPAFRAAGITTEAQFATHIESVMASGEVRTLAGGKIAYYSKGPGNLETIVIHDPANIADKGTAFTGTYARFQSLK